MGPQIGLGRADLRVRESCLHWPVGEKKGEGARKKLLVRPTMKTLILLLLVLLDLGLAQQRLHR